MENWDEEAWALLYLWHLGTVFLEALNEAVKRHGSGETEKKQHSDEDLGA